MPKNPNSRSSIFPDPYQFDPTAPVKPNESIKSPVASNSQQEEVARLNALLVKEREDSKMRISSPQQNYETAIAGYKRQLQNRQNATNFSNIPDEEHNRKIAEMEKDNLELKTRLGNLSTEHAKLKSYVQTKEDNYRKALAELKESENQEIQNLRAENVQLRQQLEAANYGVDSKTQNSNQTQSVNQKLVEFERDNNSLREKIVAMNKELHSQANQIGQFQIQSQNIQKLNEENQALRKHNETLSIEVNSQAIQLQQLQNTGDKNQMENNNPEIQNLKRQLEEEQRQNSTLIQRIDHLQSLDSSEYQARIRELEQQLRNQHQNTAPMSDDIAKLKEELSRTHSELTAARMKYSADLSSIESMNEDMIAALKHDLNRKDISEHNLLEKLNYLTQKNVHLTRELAEARGEYNKESIENEIDEYRGMIEMLKNEVRSLKEHKYENRRLKEEIEHLSSQNTAGENVMIDNYKNQLASMKETMNQLNSKIIELEQKSSQLNATKESLSKAKAELEDYKNRVIELSEMIKELNSSSSIANNKVQTNKSLHKSNTSLTENPTSSMNSHEKKLNEESRTFEEGPTYQNNAYPLQPPHNVHYQTPQYIPHQQAIPQQYPTAVAGSNLQSGVRYIVDGQELSEAQYLNYKSNLGQKQVYNQQHYQHHQPGMYCQGYNTHVMPHMQTVISSPLPHSTRNVKVLDPVGVRHYEKKYVDEKGRSASEDHLGAIANLFKKLGNKSTIGVEKNGEMNSDGTSTKDLGGLLANFLKNKSQSPPPAIQNNQNSQAQLSNLGNYMKSLSTRSEVKNTSPNSNFNIGQMLMNSTTKNNNFMETKKSSTSNNDALDILKKAFGGAAAANSQSSGFGQTGDFGADKYAGNSLGGIGDILNRYSKNQF